MSARSDALEEAVTELLAARTAQEAKPGARASARADRAFARLAELAAPTIRYFARRYGLSDHLDDAGQAGAIALHRATERYDASRARFTTFMNWQIRAELQALAQKLHGGAPVSLDALCDAGADEWLADPEALAATEARASDRLAARCADRLIAEWAARRGATIRSTDREGRRSRLATEGALVRHQLLDVEAVTARLCEADRHIVRRALADIARHAGTTAH
ncbi:sigma factor [Sphingopyxis indica]|uniref:Sigma-70 region 2 n=1 Tax=Sphingopyxis indica TaxID=436663 RepID=A0A239I4P0_9SPHN|nr:sigma factor [Sphingopyxis indica]SNS88560.1 Sigma-70 region 2 [Sphingopyxis indica]